MRKNIICYLTITFICFLLVGCGNNKKAEEYKKEIKCDLFKSNDILFVTDLNTSDKQDFVYLNNKKAYLVNYDKLFKISKQNCKLLGELNYEIIGVKGTTLFANSGEHLNIDLTSYEMKEEKDPAISYEELISSQKIFKKFYLKDDILYSNDKNIIKTPFVKGEQILTVYYQGDYIKTNKHIYKLKKVKTNSQECNKYVDVPCVYSYSFEIDYQFDNYYSELLYITVFQDADFFKTSDWFDVAILKTGEIIISDSFKN